VTLALKNIAMSFPAADYYGHPRARQRERHHFMEDMHSFRKGSITFSSFLLLISMIE